MLPPAVVFSASLAPLGPALASFCLLAGLPLPASEDVCDWPGASESEDALRATLFANGTTALSFVWVSDRDTTRAGVGSATDFDAVWGTCCGGSGARTTTGEVVLGASASFSAVKRVEESRMSAGACSRFGGTMEALAATTEIFGGGGGTIVGLWLISADHTTTCGIGTGFVIAICGGASG